MDLFKLDKYDRMFVAFILVVITLFNIGQCFASEEEDISQSSAPVSVTPNSNFFTEGGSTGYVRMEVGYRYTVTFLEGEYETPRQLAISANSPSLNGVYNYLGALEVGQSYSYIPTVDSYFLCASQNNYLQVKFTRAKLEDMNGAVDSLVENVGVNQLWNVFEGGIDFVGVIVLVAFGLFLIFLLIKKISKGKADF